MSNSSFEGSQAFNRAPNTYAYEAVIPNSGSLILNIPIIDLIGKKEGIGLTVLLSYSLGVPGALGLPNNWSFGIPFLIPQESLKIKGIRYIIDPNWADSTGYASGLKYENNHGIKFVDNVVSQPLPFGQYAATYQYTFSDIDGSSYYFDSTGKLLMKSDRYGNYIYYAYTSSNLIDYIVDSFEQKTSFGYNPNQIIITCQDGRTTTLNFSDAGMSSLIDPYGNTTYFTNILQDNFQVVSTIVYPSGKTTNVNYTSIDFLGSNNMTYSIPAVSDVYYVGQKNNLLAHYQYAYGTNSGGSTFTGLQGGYTLSSTVDGLLESNSSYLYNVEVRNLDASGNILSLLDTFYNFVHVPVQENTYVIDSTGTQYGYSQVNSTYNISPDKYNRQPNYLSPKETERLFFVNSTSSGVPQVKLEFQYDYFGNTTSKKSSSYKLSTSTYVVDLNEMASYFNQSGIMIFTLQNTFTKMDCITNQVVKTVNTLTADSKDIASSTVSYSNDVGSTWNDWKIRNLAFDIFGREISDALQWIKKDAAGIPLTSKKYTYVYDAEKFTITTKITDALGFVSTHVISTMYGKKVADILSSQATTSYVYDLLGRLTSVMLPSGQLTTYTYKLYISDGENSTTTTNSLGYQTKSVYDVLGREIGTYDNGNPLDPQQLRTLSQKQYDILGNVIVETDVFGNTTSAIYNSLKKPTQSVDPQKNKTDLIYDFSINTTTTKINNIVYNIVSLDSYGRTVLEKKLPNTSNSGLASQYTLRRAYTYGGFGNLLSKNVSRVDGDVVTGLFFNTYQYDAEAQRIGVMFSAPDGCASQKNIVYDLNNKKISHTKILNYPDKRTYTVKSDVCQYDAVGQMVMLINNSAQAEVYSYNDDGLLVSKTLFDGSVINYEYTVDRKKSKESWMEKGTPCSIDYTYDEGGRLVTTSDQNGAITNSYTLDNVLIAIAYPDGKKLTYMIDEYSRKISQLDVSGVTTTYAYTTLNQLSSVKNSQDTLTYSYYTDTSKNILFGVPKSVSLSNKYAETYQYDAHNRMNNTQKLSVSGDVILNENNVFNALDQLVVGTLTSALTNDVSLNQQRNYLYDGFKQLTQDTIKSSSGSVVSDNEFQYDGNTNVLKKTSNGVVTSYVYNSVDQLIAYTMSMGKQLTQTYDANGRLTVDGDGNIYTYDTPGKLLSVKGISNTGYTYYPNGLLAERVSPTLTIQMFYDNLQQIVNTYQDSTHTYFLMVGSKRYASYKDNSSPYYYGINQRQDTVLGLSSTSTLLGSTDYQAYGTQTNDQLGLNASNNFAWNLEYKDLDNNLVYLRARYYDPKTMRFISRDSKRLDNKYAYGNGNPINNIDPTGHDSLHVAITAAEVGVIGVIGVLALGGAYMAVTYGAGVVAAAATGTVAGTVAAAGALVLGYGVGTVGTIAGLVTLAGTFLAGAEVGTSIGAAIGASIGAYTAAAITGGSIGATAAGATIGSVIGGVIGNYAGSAVSGAVGYAGEAIAAATTAITKAVPAAATTATTEAVTLAAPATEAAIGIEELEVGLEVAVFLL